MGTMTDGWCGIHLERSHPVGTGRVERGEEVHQRLPSLRPAQVVDQGGDAALREGSLRSNYCLFG